MSNLSLAMRARGNEGEPIPTVFNQLADLGAHIRRGQVTMVSAAPGRGKSAIATHIAVNADYSGQGLDPVPTLYFSADSDRMTLGTRVCAGILKRQLWEVERMLADTTERNEAWRIINEATEHIWWNFDPSLTVEDIDSEVAAYAAVFGFFPHLIVVDNLNKVKEYGNSNHEQQARVVDALHQMSRNTSAAVMILHHVTSGYNDGTMPVPLSGIKNQLSDDARLVLTLYQYADKTLGISVVKNSTGPADPAGEGVLATVGWLPERSFFA